MSQVNLNRYVRPGKPQPQPQADEVARWIAKWDIQRRDLIRAFGELLAERDSLLRALKEIRGIVHETPGAPRYYVVPGAALNSVIAETVDPAIKRAEH